MGAEPEVRVDGASEGGVSLDALLEFAESHAPLMALDGANEARIEAARVGAGRLVPDNPQFHFGSGPRLQRTTVGADFQVGLSQRFEIAGERSARRAVARATETEILAASRDRHWDLHTMVHGLFYRAVVAQERVALARRVVAFQAEIASFVGKRRAAGQASLLDERIAEAESVNAQQNLLAKVQNELALCQELAGVIGWPMDSPPRPRAGEYGHLPVAPLAELVALASEKRPDLALLDAVIATARAKARAADSDGAPEPTVGVNWTHESSPAGGPASDIFIATISVPIPLFTNNYPARSAARAELAMAEAERQRVQAMVATEVTRAYTAAAAATLRVAAFESQVLPRFEETLAALKRAFELGEIELLALASGRERFLEANRDALAAKETYFTALAELENAVGVDVIVGLAEKKQ